MTRRNAARAAAVFASALLLAAWTPRSYADDAPSAAAPSQPAAGTIAAHGFVADSTLDLVQRTFLDDLRIGDVKPPRVWVESLQANFSSGFTPGLFGVGVDASLYGALKLAGGPGDGNMVHLDAHGGGQDQTGWLYPGAYDVKARLSKTVVRYGLQTVTNPFLEPFDNRPLPPAFLGASFASDDIDRLSLDAASFTRVDGRGHTTLTPLTTLYGGTQIRRMTYVGGKLSLGRDGTLSAYASQSDDVWRQYYASVQQSIGSEDTLKWTGVGNLYSTHDTGLAREGRIDNTAYSVSMTVQHRAVSMLVGFQQIVGNQFFDYIAETNGIYLANSADVDYNAPHEKSAQLRFGLDGKYVGAPGLSVLVWGIVGWDADASAEAGLYAAPDNPLHALYWKNGEPVHGAHHEFGIAPTYTVQGGRFKGTRIAFTAMWHHAPDFYSDSGNREFRLVVNIPAHVF